MAALVTNATTNGLKTGVSLDWPGVALVRRFQRI